MEKLLRDYLDAKNYEAIEDIIKDWSPQEIAKFFAELSDDEIAELSLQLDPEIMADVMVEMESDDLNTVIDTLPDHDLKEIMDEVSTEDKVEMFDDISAKAVSRIATEDEIVQLLSERNFKILKPLLANLNEADIALILEEIPKEDIPLVFRILPKELAADTFVEMDPDLQEHLISSLNDKEIKEVMDELFLDDTVDIIEEMPANVVKRMLAQSDKETRNYINEILKYPKDSAGSIMTIEFISLRAEMTVKQAFRKIRSTGLDKETIYTCYVTDEKNKLIGVVTAKTLMLNTSDKLIGDVMLDNVIYAETLDDKEEVARTINKYGFLALPIVDREQRLVGIVTVDDAMDILQDENTEDIEKMNAILPSDKPYLKTSVFKIWLNRVPWLLILMVSATFTGMIISKNDAILNHPVFGIILTACIPMLMDSGGNAGSQVSVTIIRGIALNEISFSDMFKVQWKELRVSILLGLTLSVACFIKLMAIDRLFNQPHGMLVAGVICLAMFCTIVIAKFIGCTLPMLAKKIHLDPAVVASPFITTIVDALSLLIFCALSVAILGGL